jgi:hypothetical protein
MKRKLLKLIVKFRHLLAGTFYCDKCSKFIDKVPFHSDNWCKFCYIRDSKAKKEAEKKRKRELKIAKRFLLIQDIAAAIFASKALDLDTTTVDTLLRKYVRSSHKELDIPGEE